MARKKREIKTEGYKPIDIDRGYKPPSSTSSGVQGGYQGPSGGGPKSIPSTGSGVKPKKTEGN